MRQTPKPFEVYRHFKGKTYQIINIAKHSETMELMVVYQQLYAPFEMYVRPLDMFVSEVDHVKYPEVTQKYRFEKVELGKENDNIVISGNPKPSDTDKTTVMEKVKEDTTSFPNEEEVESEEEFQLPVILHRFFEADTYEEKLEILVDGRDELNDYIIDTMAVSIDVEIKEGDIDRRFDELKSCLLTMEHFECNRLR